MWLESATKTLPVRRSWWPRAGGDPLRPVDRIAHEGQSLSILSVEIGHVADVDPHVTIEAVTAQPPEQPLPVHGAAARRQVLVVAAVVVGGVHVENSLAEFLDRQREDLDRKSTRLNSSHQIISYEVFCLKK